MALPLPRVVADVGPGGGLVTAMGGINSLHNDMLLRKINAVKAQYAPLTTQAEAASKLAYANLMGPQFLAKIMGNDSALANMSEDQKRAALDKIYQAGSGQGSGNALSGLQQFSGVGQPSTNSLSGWIKNALQGAFGQKPQPQQATNPFASPMQQQPIQQSNPMAHRPPNGVTVEGEQWYDKNGDPVYEEDIQEPNQPPVEMEMTQGQRPKTYAENTGAYKGTVKEGEKLGEIRAQAMSDMDEQYQQALQSEAPIDHLIDMTQDPTFQRMRANVPFFQDKQLEALSKIGTPEEQKLVGDFTTTTTNAVANTVNSFRGRILDKEISMANQMKISPKDTWNVMLGKLASIKTFNEMTKERSRIASKLMRDQHLDRGDALEEADKRVDGKAIRKQAEKQLEQKVTITNKKTGEQKTVSVEEARRLGVPNV